MMMMMMMMMMMLLVEMTIMFLSVKMRMISKMKMLIRDLFALCWLKF